MMGTFVAEGSYRGLAENRTTGFSCGSNWAVPGLMHPETITEQSVGPVV
jgi:hypothetical protein